MFVVVISIFEAAVAITITAPVTVIVVIIKSNMVMELRVKEILKVKYFLIGFNRW